MNRIFTIFIIFLILPIQVFGQCDSAYTYHSFLPSNVTILMGDSCLNNSDINVLDSIISQNELDYASSLELGTQTWSNGRLTILVAGFYFGGIDQKIRYLPENIGNWDAMTSLYLEWNDISFIPDNLGNMTNLVSFYISNNELTTLPASIGSLDNLYLLDIGYNNINNIPDEICLLENITYLWIFNNELEVLPNCFCELPLSWDTNDPFYYPYFASGGNELCENIPECIDTTEHLNISLDQFYYSFQIYVDQVCESMDIQVKNISETFQISSVYPNPFNAQLRLKLIVTNQTRMNITAYDIRGNKLELILKNKLLNVGTHYINWNGNGYASGNYFLEFDNGNRKIFHQVNLIK